MSKIYERRIYDNVLQGFKIDFHKYLVKKNIQINRHQQTEKTRQKHMLTNNRECQRAKYSGRARSCKPIRKRKEVRII
jgi:hypothetical protein